MKSIFTLIIIFTLASTQTITPYEILPLQTTQNVIDLIFISPKH